MRTTPTAPTPAPPPPTSTPRASWLDVAVGFHRAQQTHAVVLDQRAEVLSEHQPVLAIRIRIDQRMVHITLLIRPVDKIVAANALGLQLVIDILRTSTRKHLQIGRPVWRRARLIERERLFLELGRHRPRPAQKALA